MFENLLVSKLMNYSLEQILLFGPDHKKFNFGENEERDFFKLQRVFENNMLAACVLCLHSSLGNALRKWECLFRIFFFFLTFVLFSQNFVQARVEIEIFLRVEI